MTETIASHEQLAATASRSMTMSVPPMLLLMIGAVVQALRHDAVSRVGIYLAVITLAIRFNLLENPYVLTVAFLAIFGGLEAIGGVLIAGIQRFLRGDRRAG